MKIRRKVFQTPYDQKAWSPEKIMNELNKFVDEIGSDKVLGITENPSLSTKVDSIQFKIVLYYWEVE